MELDVLGLLGACSYALDCVEAELVHVTTFHAKRVAYMSVCTAEQFGVSGEALQDLAVCALLHDNALTQYLHEEFRGDSSAAECLPELPHLGAHCVMGEENISALPFHTNVENIILYHHENADGSGSFGKTWQEIPLGARIIRLCDLLDAFCRADVFTPDVWERANAFLTRVRGRIVDEECADAFLRAFSEQHFCSLGGRGLEERLWSKVPRTKQQLDFAQVKALAKFFAKIVDYKSPFTSTHSLGVADDAECLARFMGFDEDTAQKMYLAGALHDIGKVAIGNEILEKPGRLTDSEYAEMKHHAAYILRSIGSPGLCGAARLGRVSSRASGWNGVSLRKKRVRVKYAGAYHGLRGYLSGPDRKSSLQSWNVSRKSLLYSSGYG